MLTSRYAYCSHLYSLIPRPLVESHSKATCTVSFQGHLYSLIPWPLSNIFGLQHKIFSLQKWACNGMILHFASAGMDNEMCGSSKRGWVSFPVFWRFTWKSATDILALIAEHMQCWLVSLVMDENSPIYNKLYAGFHTEGGHWDSHLPSPRNLKIMMS